MNENKIVIFIAGILSAVVLVWFSLRLFEYSSLYFPEKDLAMTPRELGMAYDDVFFVAADGKKIHGWFLPAPSGDKNPVFLLFHGNAGNISHRLDKARLLQSLGVDVFLFDYRGYGQSEGRPSEKGMALDGAAAYKFLVDAKNISAERLFFYGESLGTAVAADVALRHAAAGLILESPFTSVVDMSRHYYPWLPANLIVKNRYDTLSKISRIKMPILIMHSPHDEIIPFSMAQTLYTAAPSPKDFLELQGDHNGGYATTRDYLRVLKRFIRL